MGMSDDDDDADEENDSYVLLFVNLRRNNNNCNVEKKRVFHMENCDIGSGQPYIYIHIYLIFLASRSDPCMIGVSGGSGGSGGRATVGVIKLNQTQMCTLNIQMTVSSNGLNDNIEMVEWMKILRIANLHRP